MTTLEAHSLIQMDYPADAIIRVSAPVAELGKARLFRLRFRFTAVWNVAGSVHVACSDGQIDYTYDPNVPDDVAPLQGDPISVVDWSGPAAPCGVKGDGSKQQGTGAQFGTDTLENKVIFSAILASAGGPMAGYPTSYTLHTWVTNRTE